MTCFRHRGIAHAEEDAFRIRATSAGVAQAFAAGFRRELLRLACVFDHSATSCPALIRLRAIGSPIRPSPRNPSFAIKEDCTEGVMPDR